jgi:hypothetical protein
MTVLMDNIEFLRNIYNDLSVLAKKSVRDRMSKEETYDSFYNIMRKYGIKQGKKSKDGNGISCNTAEWCMCIVCFEHLYLNYVKWDFTFELSLSNAPEDLKCY